MGAVGSCDGDGFAVVAGDDAADDLPSAAGELYGLADTEIDHLAVGADLLHQADALHDDVVQLKEFFFG